ncbi:putative CWC16 protein [Arabidopsis thaliana]
MGERKNLNKYYPPDFDPKKIHRIKKPKNQQKKIRFMLPVRVRCNTCGNYMSEGTKFNCREEDFITETYLGIKIHRFYIKCTKCLAEDIEEEKKKKHENALESLENRTVVSKREIEVMASLDELKSMKSRRASLSVDYMLEDLSRRKKQEKRITDEEKKKNYEAFDEKKKKKKKPKKRDSGTVCIISKKKTGLESLYHNYDTTAMMSSELVSLPHFFFFLCQNWFLYQVSNVEQHK